MADATYTLDHFLNKASEHSRQLFHHFVREFQSVGPVTLHPAKTMIGIATPRKRIAYITQFGKGFLHVVFPFRQPYPDNLCFQKVAQVPDDAHQYNHHFRMLAKEDVNAEVKRFMKLAYEQGK